MKTFSAFFAMLVATNATAGDISYSGKWPVTVSHSQQANGAYCITLKDDGSRLFAHSGQASLTSAGTSLPYGTFQLIDGLLTVTLQSQSDTGSNAGLVFTARAHQGALGKGVFDNVYGGEEVESGLAVFGPKGGC
jgi:hypothetical protein